MPYSSNTTFGAQQNNYKSNIENKVIHKIQKGVDDSN